MPDGVCLELETDPAHAPQKILLKESELRSVAKLFETALNAKKFKITLDL